MLNAITSPVKVMPGGLVRWLLTTTAFVAGGLAASASIGFAAGTLGAWLGSTLEEPAVAAACAVVGLAAAAHEFSLVRLPLPQLRRSSQGNWERRWGQPRAALLWGIDIGLVFTTWIAWAGVWWLALAALLTGSAATGAAVMAVFWSGRAAPVIIGPWLVPSASAGPWLDRAVEPLRPAFAGIHAVVVVGASAALLAIAAAL